jgi:hypothetical protein
MTPRSTIEALDELAALLPGLVDVRSTAAAAATFSQRQLGADLAGVARHDPKGPLLLARTSAEVDALYAAKEAASPWTSGPALGTVIADTRTDELFGDFSRHLDALGVRSFRTIVLPSRDRVITLDLFSTEVDAFTTCPDHVRMVLRYVGVTMQAFEHAENLQLALESREVIAQAQGIVMERFGLTDGQAMGLLRRQSQKSQVKVRDLAVLITEHRAEQGPGSTETRWLDP